MDRYLFIGERRSKTAMRMGVTWEHGRLCAMTLHQALAAIGIDAKDPERVWFVNLWRDQPRDVSLDETPNLQYVLDGNAIEHVRDAARLWRWTIVGLGKKVQRVLESEGIPHVKVIHPAARGAIRKTEAYQAHVAAQLAARSA